MTPDNSSPEFLDVLLRRSIDSNASDIHCSVGEPIHFRIDGMLNKLDSSELEQNKFSSQLAEEFSNSILSASQQKQLALRGSVDGAFSIDSDHRFRFNIYRRQGQISFSFRRLSNTIPTLEQLGLNPRLYDKCSLQDGLVLVVGPTGSGKSTTIASMIDRINAQRASHIITLEDPIEFIHPSQKSLVNQRQIGVDVENFHQALVDAVRQDPDIILVGELRDVDTIRTAITAAETGHLVFASLHAGDCKTAIERLISAYPAEEQELAQRLVATVLRTIVVQHLLPRLAVKDQTPDPAAVSQRVLASEVMHANQAVSNLIANANLNQLSSIIQNSNEEGMWTLDDSLARLWRQRLISEQTAFGLARNPEILSQISLRTRA
ncbi:MAG: PilT/PilU family type 4a pilus ATPase [Mariniblastus sp.]|nr:PilT/PilU family type 4a pilus ATPase [Mariniblastus sp.]MDG2183829.1 PilT/PilU family type 4a pilus ATPase [Mariniblastus sp.]